MFFFFCCIFFFQAEDGIRDAQESRGLGDVYKRQGLPSASNGKEAHKGYFDRTGNVHLLDTKIADKIIDQKCGGCLVAYYNMGIGRLLRYEKEFMTTAST